MSYIARPQTLERNRLMADRVWYSVDTIAPGSWVATWGQQGASTLTFPAANLILYTPIRVRTMIRAKKLWVSVGVTGTGTVHMGIYNRAGQLLQTTGSLAHGTSNLPLVGDITDQVMKPDLYYLAVQGSNNTDTFQAVSHTSSGNGGLGLREQNPGSMGLPSTATWTIGTANAGLLPIMGIYTEATPT